jgi:folate-binding protein YgfZ
MPEQGASVTHGSGRRPAAHERDLIVTESFVAFVDRDVVVADGPEATSYLQSLVSQDLDAVEPNGTAHCLLLQPQGKLLADFYAVRTPDAWVLIAEGGVGPALAEGLRRFKIRVKAEVREEDWAALAVRGAEVPDTPGVVVAAVNWNATPAFDVVGPALEIDRLAAALAVRELDADAYELARIEAGVPRQGADTDERTIPQEAGLERTAVSFTKGCFVGQELVCRIDSRGHVNRFLRRLRADGPLARGLPVEADGKAVGEVTSAAGSVALAMLRREVEPGASVTVGAGAAVVEAI